MNRRLISAHDLLFKLHFDRCLAAELRRTHTSCYMAVKPWYRAQTPVSIQPTASTHQLCRRKIQIVSSIQTGGNNPPRPSLNYKQPQFFFYHLSDNLSLFMQNMCQNILSTMIPNRTVQQLFSVKRLKKRNKKKNSSTTINFLSLGENKLVSCLCSEGWLFNTITIGTGMPEWKDVHGEDLLQERPLFPPLFPMVT